MANSPSLIKALGIKIITKEVICIFLVKVLHNCYATLRVTG